MVDKFLKLQIHQKVILANCHIYVIPDQIYVLILTYGIKVLWMSQLYTVKRRIFKGKIIIFVVFVDVIKSTNLNILLPTPWFII